MNNPAILNIEEKSDKSSCVGIFDSKKKKQEKVSSKNDNDTHTHTHQNKNSQMTCHDIIRNNVVFYPKLSIM